MLCVGHIEAGSKRVSVGRFTGQRSDDGVLKSSFFDGPESKFDECRVQALAPGFRMHTSSDQHPRVLEGFDRTAANDLLLVFHEPAGGPWMPNRPLEDGSQSRWGRIVFEKTPGLGCPEGFDVLGTRWVDQAEHKSGK